MIRAAVGLIAEGGAVIFPATGLYGLAADALDNEAVGRIFQIKQRPGHKPLLIMVHNRNELDRLVRHIPLSAVSIMKRFWPGGITIVFEAKKTLPQALTAGSGRIGVRVPGHRVAFDLAAALGRPLTGTSANISGQAGCARAADIDTRVADNVDLILDAGVLRGGPGSTVVDVTVAPPKILREGAISAQAIHEVLEENRIKSE